MKLLEHPARAEAPAARADPEAIIPEARRRGRWRRAALALAVVTVTGAVVAVAVAGRDGPRARSRPRSPLGASAPSRTARPPSVVVAWGDYAGGVHLGDLATRRQMQIAALSSRQSFAAGPVVEDRGRLLWSDGYGKVRSLDIATGKTIVVTRGLAVIVSPGGARLYVDQGSSGFLELNARTLRVVRRLALPAGWTADAYLARPVAGGLLVAHTWKSPHTGTPLLLGVWRPGSGVRPLGASDDLALAVYTAPTARYSLVAWVPRCAEHRRAFGSGCPLAITNTATGKTVKVPSPNRWGFTGGAFSPYGGELATFVNTNNASDPFRTPYSELALIDTTTGSLRLDPKVKMVTTEDAAWAQWLPGGRQLLTGALSATYLVNARSLAARPLYFDGADTRLQSVMNSPDLNFSTLVVPPNALNAKQRQRLGVTEASGKIG